jgi:hypothetical protein
MWAPRRDINVRRSKRARAHTRSIEDASREERNDRELAEFTARYGETEGRRLFDLRHRRSRA